MNEKPWLGQYDEEVPDRLEYQQAVIQDFLKGQVDKNPHRIALICEDQCLDYEGLFQKSQNLAFHLIKTGLRAGDRVGICLPNTIEFVISYFGTLMAGGVVAAMNPLYPVPEWQYQTGIVHPRVLIGPPSRKPDLLALQQKFSIDQLILASLSMECGRFFEWNCRKTPDSFEKIDLESQLNYSLPLVKPESPAVVQFSGGSTGIPKAALALHRNVAANIVQFTRWLTTLKEGQETFLTMIPLYHVYGMVIGLNVGIELGATIVLVPDGRELVSVLNLIQKYQVTFFPGVPSIYNAINHHPMALEGKINLRSIKACISGSAPLLLETREKFECLTGGKLVEGYGLSEAPTATHCNPIKGENRGGSMGLPLPDVDCKIVELENGARQVEKGGTGELLIRGPQVMWGYYQSPKETKMALKDGWLHTGDIARMDKDGYFYIIGRCKELIKVNGLQVWPQEVEEVLMKYPGIKEAAAAGIPDEETGEKVIAWIVLDDDENIDLTALKKFCRQYLAAYKIPKEIELEKYLIKSPVGKTLRRELIRLYLEKNKKPGA